MNEDKSINDVRGEMNGNSFSIKVHSWNRQTTVPKTLSVLCPSVLLDEHGKRLVIETHSLRPKSRPTVPKIISLPVESRSKEASTIRSFYFFPQEDYFRRNEENGTRGRLSDFDSTKSDSLTHECAVRFEKGPDEDFFDSLTCPTRIRVPNDVVKIEDRLGYILQPPIETLLGRRYLETPFAPFNYQKQGIAFLYSAQYAILADEMGLGKTMQAITAIRLLFCSGECRRVLLVCPKPLMTNWRREFELWAPEIPVQMIEGKSERRKWLWELKNTPLRIANYELLSRDREFFDPPAGAKVVYDLVVLDESQRIKNKSNVTSEAAQAIPRRRNWALTGTPVENSAEDLVGIFEFLSPGYLESGLKPSEISKLIGEHILRRTKEQTLKDLPPKLIRDAHIELTADQYETYRLAQEEGEIRLNQMGDSLTLHHAFELILRLKQICNFDPATGQSAKFDQLMADMEEIADSNRKAIVFSQWVQTIRILSDRLQRFHPIEYHGKTSPKDRDKAIERFRDDPDCHVILMSYGAGSVGLNLQFAEYVFLFDRWWNPAVEDQAINRAHRIGASKPVTVTRYVSVNTIEEKIDRILSEKRMLSEAILSDAKEFGYSIGLSQDDIFGLFNLKSPDARRRLQRGK